MGNCNGLWMQNVALQKQDRRAHMKIGTNSSKLFECICKHKDYIWLGNFGRKEQKNVKNK